MVETSVSRRFLISLSLIVALGGVRVRSQNDVTHQAVVSLLQKIDAVTATNVDYTNQLNTLNTELNNLRQTQQNDINWADGRLNGLQSDVVAAGNAVTAVEDKVTAAVAQAEDLEKSLAGVKTSIGKLDKTNVIWRKNFVVVSKTFKELRKKLSFAYVPLISLPAIAVAPRPVPVKPKKG